MLPRQARDKHRNKLRIQKRGGIKCVFLCAGREGEGNCQGKKTPFLRHFILKNDDFAKTGSGQT
jgi:hypothetical protein